MTKRKKSNNLTNFLFYSVTIISLTSSLLIYLTIKNECKNNENDISKLNKNKIHNINIIKELQSKKENLLTETNITNMLSNKMIAVAPETLIVRLNEK